MKAEVPVKSEWEAIRGGIKVGGGKMGVICIVKVLDLMRFIIEKIAREKPRR